MNSTDDFVCTAVIHGFSWECFLDVLLFLGLGLAVALGEIRPAEKMEL